VSVVACSNCRARAALIAALAPAIARMALAPQRLLALLALSDEQLLGAVQIESPSEFLSRLEASPPSITVPTALCRHDPQYPRALAQLACAPAVLYATCTPERLGELLAKPLIALVGNRAPTDYARRMTSALMHELVSAGVTIIGDWSGQDQIALDAAQHAGGHSIGVMASSAEHPYQGAAISEFPPGFSPIQRWCFTASQRIIAALASLVVVVEAEERSTALLTAQLARAMGRNIAVVPGRVIDPGGPGMLDLLREGAAPVACTRDVLELLPMVHTTEHRPHRIAA
jgi:DNA processing protein